MLWHVRRYYWPMMAVSKSGVFRVMLPDVLQWQFGLLSWHNERTGCEHFSCLVIVLLWWQFMFFFVTIEYVIVCFVITGFWSLLLLEWKRLSLICLQYDTVLFAVALSYYLWRNGSWYQCVLALYAFLTGAILKGLILWKFCVWCLCMFCVNFCWDWFCGFWGYLWFDDLCAE